MRFGPGSWLVALIADGLVVSGEKSRGLTPTEYRQTCVNRESQILNANIRKVKETYGLRSPEWAYERIRDHISVTQRSFTFSKSPWEIVIDLENQEYIIELLKGCIKEHMLSQTSEGRAKNEAYCSALNRAIEARTAYIQSLETKRTQENRDRETSDYLTVVGLAIFVLFVIFFLSLCV